MTIYGLNLPTNVKIRNVVFTVSNSVMYIFVSGRIFSCVSEIGISGNISIFFLYIIYGINFRSMKKLVVTQGIPWTACDSTRTCPHTPKTFMACETSHAQLLIYINFFFEKRISNNDFTTHQGSTNKFLLTLAHVLLFSNCRPSTYS